MKRLAIFSTGDYAKQIVDFASMTGEFIIVGFIDKTRKIGELVMSYPVICTDEQAYDCYINGLFDCVFIGVGYAQFPLKKKLYELVKGKIPLANIINPTAIIYPTVQLGEGIYIGPYCIIGKETVIDDNVAINHGVLVEHNCHLLPHSYIGGRSAIAGNVFLGEMCFVGMNATIKNGLIIGNQCVIGMGGTYLKNISNNEVWVGNPGHFIRKTYCAQK